MVIFQFQLGTIGTLGAHYDGPPVVLFQFQLGTIGTIDALFVNEFKRRDFNSS